MTDLTLAVDRTMQLADTLSKSKVIAGLAGAQYSREDLFAICLMGERLGIDPVAAITGIYVVKGRPYIGARLVRGLILKNGHTFNIDQWTGDAIHVTAGRRGQEPKQFIYTMKEAAHSGLTGKENWRLHPRRMLLNAVTRHVMDACFADLFLGISVDDDSDPEPQAMPVKAVIAPSKPAQLSLSSLAKEP